MEMRRALSPALSPAPSGTYTPVGSSTSPAAAALLGSPGSSSGSGGAVAVLSPGNSKSMNSSWSLSLRAPLSSTIRRLGVLVVVGSVILYTVLYFWVFAAMTITQPIQHTRFDKEKLTVVINTFKRHDMMADAVGYYTTCDIVKYIYVVWSENNTVPEHIESPYRFSGHPKVSLLLCVSSL
jgi:hypothetical protein